MKLKKINNDQLKKKMLANITKIYPSNILKRS